MTRRKKKSSILKPAIAGIAVALMVFSAGASYMFWQKAKHNTTVAKKEVEQSVVEIKQEFNEFTQKEKKNTKAFVKVVFLGTNEKGEEVYKVVKRPNSTKKGSKFQYAIKSLLKGPNFFEKNRGVFSEIPSGVKILSINETSDKITIDLSDSFEQGGGTNSLYERLYQIIKTANKNTQKPVYLNLDGKQVDVIGGDGIMFTQPLSEKSLEG
ncbi:GerMN domain-containing protein [bacterium]|nr:GerMN domain-containing protein [bacterium]